MTSVQLQNELTKALCAALLRDEAHHEERYTAVLRFDGLVPKMEVEKIHPKKQKYGPQRDREMLTSVEMLFFQKDTSRIRINRIGLKNAIHSETVCVANMTGHQKMIAQSYAVERTW